MLNTLANHGFLPHNGRNITLDKIKTAFSDGINMGDDIAIGTFTPGLATNPDPNADVSWTHAPISISSSTPAPQLINNLYL